MDFIKVRRRISYRDRMRMLKTLLNKSGNRELSVRDVVKAWQLTPPYIVKLMRWCADQNHNIYFDENYGVLCYNSPLSPTYRSMNSQTQLVK